MNNQMLEENIAITIRETITSLIKGSTFQVFDETPLQELGIDSLDFFEKIIELEERHGIVIPIDRLEKQITLRSIISAAVSTRTTS